MYSYDPFSFRLISFRLILYYAVLSSTFPLVFNGLSITFPKFLYVCLINNVFLARKRGMCVIKECVTNSLADNILYRIISGPMSYDMQYSVAVYVLY